MRVVTSNTVSNTRTRVAEETAYMARKFGSQETPSVDNALSGERGLRDAQENSSGIEVATQLLPAEGTSEKYECPVCENVFEDLGVLNNHLDTDHGFAAEAQVPDTSPIPPFATIADASLSPKKHDDSQAVVKPIDKQNKGNSTHRGQQFKLSTSHYEKRLSKNECNTCHKTIDIQNSINCRKCGRIQCIKHCRNAIRLNSLAKYDPENGEWCRCCRACFIDKPGRDDLGMQVDISREFQALRRKHLEDSELIILQLDMRLVKLINGINMILERHKYSFISKIQVSKDILKLEKELVEWEETSTTCSSCQKNISSMTTKKHHCRLCGQHVCNDDQYCYKDLPLLLLCAVIESVNEDGKCNLPMDLRYTHNAVAHPDIMIKFCRNCTRLSFISKKYQMDLKQPLPPMLQNYEKIYNIIVVLNSLIPKILYLIDKLESENAINEQERKNFIVWKRKIFNSFELFEYLNKQIATASFENNQTYAIIQRNISLASTNFIQKKLIPLRSKMAAILEKDLLKEKILRSNNPEADRFIKTSRSAQDIKTINADREQLMVLQEQKFLVESMIEASAKARKFDEVEALKANLDDINVSISELQQALGDDGF